MTTHCCEEPENRYVAKCDAMGALEKRRNAPVGMEPDFFVVHTWPIYYIG
jgi:hypothetical protein